MKNHKIQWLAALLACTMLTGCGEDGETTESTGIDSGSGGNGGGVGGGTNDNGGRLQFGVTSLTVAEGVGNATVTVTRTGGSDGAVGVTVTSRDGSSTQPADYTAVSTTVSFAAGDTAEKTVTIPIIGDTAAETAETLYLNLSNATGGASLGSASEALITITDDDVAAPAASRAVISSAGAGLLRIDWTASTGATSYRIMKDATGSAGFTQVGADLPESARSTEVSVSVHQEDWVSGRYAIAACNSAGCTQSAPVSAEGLSAAAITYVKAAHGLADDRLGQSVALSADGNTLAVYAEGDDSAGTGVNADPTRADCNVWPAPAGCDSGAVYVYSRTGGTWSAPVYIKSPVSGTYNGFGAGLALSADGNTLAISAPGENNSRGNVYVYTRSGATWQLAATVVASDAADGDAFGASLALTADGTLMAVGAWNRTDGATLYAGGVYVFSRSGQTWTQQTVLTAPVPEANSYFGRTVTLGGTGAAPVLAVGHPYEDATTGAPPTTIYSVGAVYVFTLQGATWSSARIPSPTVDYYVSFGTTVAFTADGTLLAIADEADITDGSGAVTAFGAGSVRIYGNTGGTWTAQSTLLPSNPQDYMGFGGALAWSGDGNSLVAGAQHEDGGGSGVQVESDIVSDASGAAYVFTRDGTAWSTDRYIKPSNTHQQMYFGIAVALDHDGGTLAVGAPREDGPSQAIGGSQLNDCGGAQTQCADASGAVYVY